MSEELDRHLYNWEDADSRERMSYLSFAELVEASEIWDKIIANDGGDPTTCTVTLHNQLELAHALLVGIGLSTPAVAVRCVYWFS